MISEKHKVIIVTPGGSIFRDPHVRAFESFGYKCITFDSRNGFVYNPLFRSFSRRIPGLIYLKKIKVWLINKRLVDLARERKPKYLFVQKGETITPATIEAIKSMGIVTANFYNDFEWSVASKIAPHYDYFFTQHRLILEKLWSELNLKNCFHMHHAAEPLPDPFTNRQNKYDITFLGTYNKKLYPNREKYLTAVKDLDLHIWGNDDWLDTPLKDHFHGRANGDERLSIYSKSKVVIDINWEHFSSNGISVRPFEVTASGACLFIDLAKQDIKSAYEENKEFVSFSSVNELRNKIEYYLGHNEEREKIAQAGYDKTVARHTYVARIKQFFDTIENPGKYLYK